MTHLRLNIRGVAMPAVIFMMVIMSLVAYATLVGANNGLSIAYKQMYISMARQASKAGVDYAQEQFEQANCDTATGLSTYSGTGESQVSSTANSRYKITFQVESVSSDASGTAMTIKSTGRVYLPITTAAYTFDIRAEIIRNSAPCRDPGQYDPIVWFDAGDASTLISTTTTSAPTTVTDNTTFGSAGAATRDTVEERVSNGAQTTQSWQSSDLEMHVCDSAEFTSPSNACTSTSTRYLYNGMIFNINIPKNATVTTATLNINGATPSGTGGSVTHQIYGIYDTSTNPLMSLFTSSGSNQVRTRMTTANLHTTASASFSANNFPPGNAISVDVGSVVQEMVNNANWPASGGGNLGLGVQRTASSSSASRKACKGSGSGSGYCGLTLSVTYTTTVSAESQAVDTGNVDKWSPSLASQITDPAIITYGTSPTKQSVTNGGKTFPVVRFTGGAMKQNLSTNVTGSLATAIIVAKINSSSTSDARYFSGMNSGNNSDSNNANALAFFTRGGSLARIQTRYNNNSTLLNYTSATDGAFAVYTIVMQPSGNIIRRNGTEVTGSNDDINMLLNQLWIGGIRNSTDTAGVNYMNGDISEIALYDAALACKQYEAIEDSLRIEYGLSASAWTSTCPNDPIPVL